MHVSFCSVPSPGCAVVWSESGIEFVTEGILTHLWEWRAAVDQRDPWVKLLSDVRPARPHPDPGSLGEYGLMLTWYGRAEAQRAFPDVHAHLEAHCDRCSEDLRQVVAFAEE